MGLITIFFVFRKIISSSILCPPFIFSSFSACSLLLMAGQESHIALGSTISASKSDFLSDTKTFPLFSWSTSQIMPQFLGQIILWNKSITF